MPRLYLYARVRFLHTLHTRPRVQRAPGIPCALLTLGRTILKTWAHRAADRGVVLDVAVIARSEAAKQSIVTSHAEGWIASLRSQ
jgi:hypothetical protein